jgi:hypothetical protein
MLVCQCECAEYFPLGMSANFFSVIMILRVYALWNRSTIVMTVLLTLWTAQIVISAVGLHTGFGECLKGTLFSETPINLFFEAVPLPAILTGTTIVLFSFNGLIVNFPGKDVF